MSKERCQSKNPALCRFHGKPASTSFSTQNTFTNGSNVLIAEKSLEEELLKEDSPQQEMFHLFKAINETLKTDLCKEGIVETVDDETSLTTGFTYKCKNCDKIHYFTRTDYDKTKGGKALSFMFKQLPQQHRNNQFLVPIQTLQEIALNESFTRHYPDEEKKTIVLQKLRGKMGIAASIKNAFEVIEIPSVDREDWSPLITTKEGFVYIEPDKVPKEILYKFSQCLRKKQHDTPEDADASMKLNRNEGKEVYKCPHCKKYHYGRSIDPNRTEEERYEFAKKTWAMPAYREVVSLVSKTYGLDKKTQN